MSDSARESTRLNDGLLLRMCTILDEPLDDIARMIAIPFVLSRSINDEISRLVKHRAPAVTPRDRFVLIEQSFEITSQPRVGTSIVAAGKDQGLYALGHRQILRVSVELYDESRRFGLCNFAFECGAASDSGALAPLPIEPWCSRGERIASVSRQIADMLPSAWAEFSADPNPIHIDRAAATDAGYPRPLLHGMCSLLIITFAAARRADSEPIRAARARFPRPIYGGDTLSINMYSTAVASTNLISVRTSSGPVLRALVDHLK